MMTATLRDGLPTMSRELEARMSDVVDECLGKIPSHRRFKDIEAFLGFWPSGVLPFSLPEEKLMPVAVKARRFAKNRAQAMEWAYDALLAKTGMYRVGEVLSINGSWLTYVRERDELQ